MPFFENHGVIYTTMMFALLVPIIIFAIFESLGSLKKALIAAVIAVILEALFSYYYIGHIDSFTVFSVFLVIVLAVLAYQKDARRIFYLKPAILSLALGFFIFGAYIFFDIHILKDGLSKYSQFFTEEQQMALSSDVMKMIFNKADLTIGLAYIFNGLLTLYAALKLSRWIWLTLAIIGPFVATFLGFYAALFA